MAAFARARTMFSGLPNMPSLCAYPQRNWKEAATSSKVHGLPTLGVRLTDLAQRLQVYHRLVIYLVWIFLIDFCLSF